jgi:hypothetical protein
MLEYQEFSSKYIGRRRLVSFLKALFPPEHGDHFEVHRRLDTWIVKAPRVLNDVSPSLYACLGEALTYDYHDHSLKLQILNYEKATWSISIGLLLGFAVSAKPGTRESERRVCVDSMSRLPWLRQHVHATGQINLDVRQGLRRIGWMMTILYNIFLCEISNFSALCGDDCCTGSPRSRRDQVVSHDSFGRRKVCIGVAIKLSLSSIVVDDSVFNTVATLTVRVFSQVSCVSGRHSYIATGISGVCMF